MNEGHSWEPAVNVIHVIPPAPGSAFRCALPREWERLPLLSEEPDFSDPTSFMPLGAFMADAGSMILTVAGRPVCDSAAPAHWLAYLCRELGFDPRESASVSWSGNRALTTCHASQATSRGPMEVRLALFEERGQWILLTVMAVASRRESMEQAFVHLLESFELQASPTPAIAKVHQHQDSIIPFPIGVRSNRDEIPEIREPLRPAFRFATT